VAQTILKPLPAVDAHQVARIPIDLVRPNPHQPRRYFSDENIFELAQSIAQCGLIQPIVVRRTAHDYELIAGERRLRACSMLGWKRIDAVVVRAGESESAVMAMIENLQRENLHFFEEAEGYLSLLRKLGITQEDLAKRVGKNQCTIANKIRLLRLPQGVKRQILRTGLSERQARAILRLPDETAQSAAIAHIARERLNVKETDAYIEKLLTRQEDMPPPRGPKLTTLAGDPRLYVNSLKEIVRRMSSAGFSPKLETNESAGAVEIRILIPKTR